MGKARSVSTLGTAAVTAGQTGISTGTGFIPGQVSEVRQTVVSGPTDASGFPNFLTFATSTVSLQNVNSTTPLVLSAAAGFNQYGRVDRYGFLNATGLTWTGLSTNGTYYLYMDVSTAGIVTTGSTILAPVYQYITAASTTNNQNTFVITTMSMFAGNGSTATQVYRVFVGEATVAGSVVTAVTPYAYMGKYDSGFTATLPALASRTAKSHNIGVKPAFIDWIIENTTTEFNHSVGDQIGIKSIFTNDANVRPLCLVATASTVALTVSTSTAFQILNATTGATSNPTLANWKYKFIAQRGW